MSDERRYRIEFTDASEADLEAIHDYLVAHDPHAADLLLDRLVEKAVSLASFPDRGSIPDDLAAMGVHDHRQLLLSPYRMIYHVGPEIVAIVLIADGRRDMRALLRYRLLTAR
ncbi:hypothetical protein CAP40_12175 [Sphingomonas sp. IBVSS2]|uniref:type II toxin-antitoxin system RelE/ParE family toxin n=1 Tax=Sphingomonas sp. IBVSS2 TaxID=1985172 RepID=UPI000A2DD498|nr:type II toxin-antitoxin system RelE/ParE family toxin [Sphingomonas sp. IBVSS2]OSZ66616.1 hypothetical protein CAP40_12175 [Sphingomonas sp. IBVSS2]